MTISKTRLALSIIILLAVLAVLGIRVFEPVDLGTAQVEDILLAGLVGAFTTVTSYYFKR